jgi:hypothetical protein
MTDSVLELIKAYRCPACGATPSLVAAGRRTSEVLVTHERDCRYYRREAPGRETTTRPPSERATP